MTPDLTTPEGRAELRAYYPPGGTLKIDAHMNAALDAIDAETERSAALAREISALRSDLDDALVSVIKNQCHIDTLDAQIERLAAPVTEEEGRKAIELYNGSPNNDASDLYEMRAVLDAFIASRKEPAP